MINNKMNIGILSPSAIATKRFLPALVMNNNFFFYGMAYATKNERQLFVTNNSINNEENSRTKVEKICKEYGGNVYKGYESLIEDKNVDAIYIPLPPALHYYWAKKALKNGKHVLLEKPATINEKELEELICIAQEKDLAIYENYMFIHHSQIEEIKELIRSDNIGEPWLYRFDFGFPRRENTDFRYNKKLGGGALLDCGGYVIKAATEFLGESIKLNHASSSFGNFEVDIFGTATLTNCDDKVAQVAFGMDNDYRCNIEIWGSKGTLKSFRLYTAPPDINPLCVVTHNGEEMEIKLSNDTAFLKSINYFEECIKNKNTRKKTYSILIKQQSLLNEFREKIKNENSSNRIK